MAHYLYNEFCYVDCELIEGANLINGPSGKCECQEGYGWEDEPYISNCVSCDEFFPGCGECDMISTDKICLECLSINDVVRKDELGC